MSIIHKLEPKLGRFAIPGLLKAYAGLQLLIFFLLQFEPGFVEWLQFDAAKIYQGQAWRVLTGWLTVVQSSFIWAIILAMFLLMLSDALDDALGPFRLTVMILSSVVLTNLVCLVLPFVDASILGGPAIKNNIGLILTNQAFPLAVMALLQCLFLIFAAHYPDRELRVFFLIPVKVRYLGWLAWGWLIFLLISPETLIPSKYVVLTVMIPYLAYSIPRWISHARDDRARISRRLKFEHASQAILDDNFHVCHRCKRTEEDNPNLEFRVYRDGEEYCLPCLTQIKNIPTLDMKP